MEERSCDDCIHQTIRDYGYGQYEIHDYWCLLNSSWCTTICRDFNDGSETDE